MFESIDSTEVVGDANTLQSESPSTEDSSVAKNSENLKNLIDRNMPMRSSGTVVGTTNIDIEGKGTTLELVSAESKHDSFEVLQKWEGVVTKLEGDSFIAHLKDLSFDSEDEEAEFPTEEISDGDRELLAPGAVFYWCIGYWKTVFGQRIRASEIRFRRLPAWSSRELSKAHKDAEELSDLLDWK